MRTYFRDGTIVGSSFSPDRIGRDARCGSHRTRSRPPVGAVPPVRSERDSLEDPRARARFG